MQQLISGPRVSYTEAQRRLAGRLAREGVEHPDAVATDVLAEVCDAGWEVVDAGAPSSSSHPGGAK